MNRRAAIAFALVGCYLAVSMVPVMAASAELAVGSQHTEFGSGSGPSPTNLVNATVDGSGSDASVTLGNIPNTTIDDFEDGDLDEYSGDLSYASVESSPTYSGSYALNLTSDGFANRIYTTSGVPTPEPGDSFQFYTYADGAGAAQVIFGFQDSNNFYYAGIEPITDAVSIKKMSGGSRSTLSDSTASIDQRTWYEVEIAWETDGTITITVYTTEGQFVGRTTVTDTEFGAGGVGWNANGPDTGDTAYFDHGANTKVAETAQYLSANHSVSNAEVGWTNFSLSNATASVEWQAWDSSGGQWQVVNSSQYDTTGNYTLDISGTAFETWRVNVTFNKTGENPIAELHDEGILFDPSAPTANNSSASPQGGETIQQKDVELSIPVTDHDFGTRQGDSATVNFYLDGSQVDTQTISSNQTVSTTVTGLEGGSHTWHVKLEDSYGETNQSDTFTFNSPDTIYIRNETNPTELVKGSNISIEVSFYGDDRTITRETSDGTVDMTGIPTNEEFVVVAQADGWYQRRVIVDNLATQQNIFLLNETEDGVPITFELDDQTGQYPSDSTRLYVQASLNLSSDSEASWYTIGGDYFGASESYPIALEKGGRYRIVAENDDAPRRELGAYIAEEPKTEPLRIGQVEFDIGGSNDTYTWRANYSQVENDSDYIQFQYSDPKNNTTNFELTIYNQSNPDHELYSTTDSELGELSVLRVLNASEENTTWVVNWTAEYGGERITGERTLGATKHPVDLNIDPMHQKLLVGLLVVFVAGMFSGPFSRTGAVVVSGLGAVLWSMAWLPVPVEYVLAAIAIAVMGRMAYAGGVSSR